MKDNSRKKIINLIMAIMTVVMFILAFYNCDRKEGYYVDEPWSYGLANSYYKPFLQDYDGYMENWHDGSFFMDYVETSEEDTFSYDSVFYNQSHDVHPPMFYCLLHTVCSFFPGSFSKWYGLSINLLLFVIQLNILFALCKLFFDKDSLSPLASVLIYGINAGAMSMVVYLRMYTLATMWTLLFVYLTCRFVKKVMEADDNSEDVHGKKAGRISLKNLNGLGLIPLALTVMCGILSHYFFVVFCGMFGFFCALYMFIVKRRKETCIYTIACVVGGTVGFLIFPSMWSHFMDTNVSWEVLVNLKNFNIEWITTRLSDFYGYIAKEWTGGTTLLSVLLITELILMIIHLANKERRKRSALLYILATTVVCHFVLIAEIAIDLTDRYHFFIYPFMGLIALKTLYDILSDVFTKKNVSSVEDSESKNRNAKADIIVTLAGTCLAIILAIVGTTNYIYPGYGKALEEMGTTYKDVPAFYVCKGDHVIINDCLFAGQQDAVYPIYYDKLDEIPDILASSDYDTSKGLVVYAEIYWNEEETAERVAKMTGLKVDKKIYDNTYTQIYYLSEGEKQ